MADPSLAPLAPGDAKWNAVTSTSNSYANGHTKSLAANPSGPKSPPSYFSHAALPPKNTAYRLSSQLLEEDVPLLMRFMHKPLRSQLELKRALDPTRRNSLLNSKLNDTLAPSDTDQVDETLSTLHLDTGKKGDNTEGTDDDDDATSPPMFPPHRLVRKKSGEIVKLLLKDTIADINRSRSLPLTPTYKQVHFGGDNHVRYFKQKDKPAAILAQNSPTLEAEDNDNYIMASVISSDDESEDSEDGYLGRLDPYDDSYMLYEDNMDDELNPHVDHRSSKRSTRKFRDHLDKTHYPRLEWKLELLDFPQLLYQEKIMLRHAPVFLEQTFLSIDKKYLLGQIAVRNLLYEKSVSVHYTLDNWATIVEIPTIYVPDAPSILRTNNYDRFVFKILLDLLFNGLALNDEVSPGHRERTYELCIRYATPDYEYWDNNDSKNYLLRLRRYEKSVEMPKHNDKMPLAARSKQQAHIKKPKYSSSYLKRIVSEPSLSKTGESALANAKPPGVSSEYNDFELNNYYLSSPLLLSLNNRDLNDHPFRAPTGLTDDRIEKATPSPAVHSTSSLESVDPISPTDEPVKENYPPFRAYPQEPVSPKPSRHKRIDSMSYKELLDSYCFFSAPSGDNLSNTTLVLSDEPNMLYKKCLSDPQPNRSIAPDDAFTVSSFLRD